jgi:glycosyltransferase involved in cell wall biosynthesis
MRDLCPSVPAITIPDSVDLALFDPSITKQEARMALGLDPKERLVVYGGRFSTMGESKGIGMLDHAVHHLAETESTLTLMLVGGSTQEFVTYEKRHPAPTTICVPSVSREQLAKYYRAADWLVMPFPKTHHYAYEMSPLKLFEYMASGTPILTSDLPSVREILTQEMAVFFPPENEEALARALRHAQDPMNQMRLEEMARRAKQRVQAFSWKARAERILSFL